MGSYTFVWEHPAEEVFVTGSFDDWKKTVKLEKTDGVFKKTVELPKEKVQYKFVVDGQWRTNDSAPGEDDGHGYYNNILTTDDIKEPDHVQTLSSAAPESSTAALAGAVPKESQPAAQTPFVEGLPGAFPLTPAGEPQAYSVNPIPATDGPGNPIKLAPGEKVPDPSTLTSNTIYSTVQDDKPEPKEEESVSIAPIPATSTLGNPIHLEPGEKVPDPSTLTSNTIESTVNTDAESYAKSDALPGLSGAGVTIQSAAPISTTAALAANVPLEPKSVPEAVLESRKEADFAPEATDNVDAVETKNEVEKELTEKIPEQPPAAESSPETEEKGLDVGSLAAGVTAGTSAFAAATYAAKDKAAEALGMGNQGAQVPAVVSKSLEEAHVSPEASASPEAVEEKAAVEAELLKEVKKTDETGEPAPKAEPEEAPASNVPEVVAESQNEAHTSPEAAASTKAVEEKAAVEAELLKEVKKVEDSGEPAPKEADAGKKAGWDVPKVPEVVAQSQEDAHASPEASANQVAVEEKASVEAELLKEVKKTDEGGEPAPKITEPVAEEAPIKSSVPAAALEPFASADVPPVVAKSQQEAHVSPEASANPEAVEEKAAVESELLKEVKKIDEAGEPAPTVTAATSATAPGDEPVPAPSTATTSKPTAQSEGLNAPAEKPAVPPTSKPDVDSNNAPPKTQSVSDQAQPIVTTGVETTKTAEQSTPAPEIVKKDSPESAKAAPESTASGTTDKKKKRRSIFGKLKDKLLH